MRLWDKPLTMLLRVGVILVIAFLAAGPHLQRAVTATVLPRFDLEPLPAEPRVHAQAGADALAAAVAKVLPQAMERLAQNQGHSLTRLTVDVYANPSSYQRLGGCPPQSRACAFRGRLSVAPYVPAQADALLPLITHELSHVLLQQRMGMMNASRLPPWFAEGLAVLVAEGGGREGISDTDAMRAITQGQHFSPLEPSRLWKPADAARFGLDHRMFYAQSALFVQHLKHRHPEPWQDLMIRLHAGVGFDAAVRKSFPQGLGPAWDEFLRSVRR